jgi:hypothetical protein
VERAAAQAKIDQQLAEMKVFPVHLTSRGHNPKPVLFCLWQARHDKDLADLAAGVYVAVFLLPHFWCEHVTCCADTARLVSVASFCACE